MKGFAQDRVYARIIFITYFLNHYTSVGFCLIPSSVPKEILYTKIIKNILQFNTTNHPEMSVYFKINIKY